MNKILFAVAASVVLIGQASFVQAQDRYCADPDTGIWEICDKGTL